ncbi:hypothetical protein T459_22811 [Capsicum annuum]|uniref:Uncharacterized protein n=1 Tax=Capsicum annuum TaxID=4072 RepID=A0A2G2YQJ7_CAPAN|nr:hypothetical protein T459_22811 [Capsicum annuum]
MGTGNTVIPSNPLETPKNETIARLTQEIEDLRRELNRDKDLTNFSITLQSPLPKPRNATLNPPCFPSLDSPVPENFPPQHSLPTNNNLPPTTPANPPNQLPIFTPPQSHPPTYITYATPPNPALINPPNQSLVHILYASPPVNTYSPT